MKTQVDVLLSPAEQAHLDTKSLAGTACVVFDILRATTTMVTALHNGAQQVTVVDEIAEAIALKNQHTDWLLAGERGGQRIMRGLTGSVDFDFGNSPREFTPDRVSGQSIVMTTTNGTRALRACRYASLIVAGAFLNLAATAQFLQQQNVPQLLLICAGTGNSHALEDAIAAGVLLEMLPRSRFDPASDACKMVTSLATQLPLNLGEALSETQNGRRLSAIADLHPDVEFCAQRNTHTDVICVRDDIARLVR